LLAVNHDEHRDRVKAAIKRGEITWRSWWDAMQDDNGICARMCTGPFVSTMWACLHASESGDRASSGPKNLHVAFFKNQAAPGMTS
jgi:hypothetical protein